MRPRIVPATTREPFLSGFVTKSRASRPIGADSDGAKVVSPSCALPPAAIALGREGRANRRCLAGAAAGRTAAVGLRTARGLVRRLRRVARGRRPAAALRAVAEAGAVGLASGLGSSSSRAIFAFVVLRGLGAG